MCISDDGICYMCGGAYPGAPDPDDAQNIRAVYDRCWCDTSSKDGHVNGGLTQSGMHPTAVSLSQTPVGDDGEVHPDEDDVYGDDESSSTRFTDRFGSPKAVSYHRPGQRRAGNYRPKPSPKRRNWKSLLPEAKSSEGWFPTEIESAYLASVKLPHGTSLLIDTGSPGNITSDGWSQDHAQELQRAGMPNPSYTERTKPMVCSGIGHGTQEAYYDVTHPICLGAGRLDQYVAPELPDARTPALLGQRSMKKLRCLIDTFTGKLFLVGPGGYEIRLSPGSEVHGLEESPAGHLMLPCSRFGSQAPQNTSEAQTFLVGDFFEQPAAAHVVRTVKDRAPVDVAVADMLWSLDTLAEAGESC